MSSFHSFTVKDSKGNEFPLIAFKNKVLLVVNVASHCGYTNQYAGLEELQKEFGATGFSVVGFPCNQFGAQEPGSDAEIQEFCSLKFNTTFPVLAKIDVNGKNAHPVYEYMKETVPGILGTEAIKWNFTKFLIGKDGKVLKRYAPQVEPKDIIPDIKSALK